MSIFFIGPFNPTDPDTPLPKLAWPESATPSQTFKVTWTIEIDAENPQQAAEKALALHRDPNSIATVFEVSDGKDTYTVDPEDCD